MRQKPTGWLYRDETKDKGQRTRDKGTKNLATKRKQDKVQTAIRQIRARESSRDGAKVN